MDGATSAGRYQRPVGRPSRVAAVGEPQVGGGRGLLAAVAALVVVVIALWGDLGWLVVAVVALLVAVMAGWAALVHRGTTRVVVSIVAVLALIGLVVALLRAVSLVELVLVVVLLALSGSAARYALGHDLAGDPLGASARVAPAQRGVLLMNPWSGGGKVARFGLVAEAQRRGVRPVVLGEGDDLVELAEQAVREGADVLGMAGGDGSQALVADVARRHDLGFVCIPAGTRNHFALDLGLDRDDVVAALDAYGSATERRIDLALIGDRIFVNNASLGVYATVVQSEEYRAAKMSTAVQMLPDLLGPDQPGFDLRFLGPDGDPAARSGPRPGLQQRLPAAQDRGIRHPGTDGSGGARRHRRHRRPRRRRRRAGRRRGRGAGRPVPRLPGVDYPGVPDRVRRAAA